MAHARTLRVSEWACDMNGCYGEGEEEGGPCKGAREGVGGELEGCEGCER